MKLIMFLTFALGFVAGSFTGWMTGDQSANALLDAGFSIVDPDGYEVERFDEWSDSWCAEHFGGNGDPEPR